MVRAKSALCGLNNVVKRQKGSRVVNLVANDALA